VSGAASGESSEGDSAFVNFAATANMAEVAQGQLAGAQTGNPAATEFAQWMVADHGGAEAALQTIATQEGVSLPSGLDQANQQALAELQPLTDGAFFASYVAGQAIAHANSLTAFIQEAQAGQDPAIKAHASTGISTLAGHLAGVLTLAQSTPGAEAQAGAIDNALSQMLTAAAATGNAPLTVDLLQIAKLQPGFTPPQGLGGGVPLTIPTMPMTTIGQ
jgi:predicted outer membrane protein